MHMHETLNEYSHAQHKAIHESRFLRQTRHKAEIVGLTRNTTQATPSFELILL